MKKPLASALLITAALLSGSAGAQTTYPDKPVKIVVPFAPGGSFDLIARDLSTRLAAL